MTKAWMYAYLNQYKDDEDISLAEILREYEEAERERIEEIEERQHMSGFYAFQDKMAMWRYER